MTLSEEVCARWLENPCRHYFFFNWLWGRRSLFFDAILGVGRPFPPTPQAR